MAVLALALAFACADEPAAPPVLQPATLAIVQPSVPTLAVGNTIRLAVEVRDQYGQVVEEPAVAWSSQDPRRAGRGKTTGAVTVRWKTGTESRRTAPAG